MLNLSNGTITLVKSRHFIRVALFVHIYAIYILWCSALPSIGKGMLTFCLLIILARFFCNSSLGIPFKKLDLQSGKWFLYDTNDAQYIYERHRIIIEMGIFFLIELSNSDEKKTKVVFFDQLPAEDYRTLKLLEKMY